jgi:peptide-methionine (S)-S-oxide reductase
MSFALKSLRFAALAVAGMISASQVHAATATQPIAPPHKSAAKAVRQPTEIATFAGGCFWCEEATFEGYPGVISVTSGYTGGTKKDPTYEEVSAGGTGHAESIEIVFDPAKTTYAALLDLYWHNIDPTQTGGQFCDHGSQYRSAIFYHGEAQRRLALQSERQLESMAAFKGRIATQIVAATVFYPAEDYHQDYYRKNPVEYHAYRMGCGRDARLKEIWGKPGREARE